MIIELNERRARQFWKKVEKTDGCWLWTASKKGPPPNNYGKFWVGKKEWSAHRLSYAICRGAIPFGLHILHKCDNPQCVNPEHLFLGTHQRNMKDRHERGRDRGGAKPGEDSPTPRLRNGDVQNIRALCGAGYLQKDCAVLWGVHKATVNDLVLRKTWGHLP